MSLSDEDRLAAAAARYLFDHGYDDLALLALKSKVTEAGEDCVEVICPAVLYDILNEYDAHEHSVVIPGASARAKAAWTAFCGLVSRREDDFEVRPQLGIVTRDPATQAELLQLAHGSDAPSEAVEAIPIKPQQRPMLVTPIPILPVAPQKRDPILCFVIMPFAPAFRPIYEDAIRPAVQTAGLLCRRADDIMQPGDIMAQVWQSLLQASLVIADLTGVNGNVFYELGLAHVLGHQAILLTQNRADIPFDLQRQRYIEYQPTQQGVQELRASLEIALRHAHAMVK